MTEQKKKSTQKMGFSLISAGFIFLFFPDFTVIDLLPDIIGYILISSGLTKLADMYDEFSDTKKAFHRLILLGIAKFFSIFIVYLFGDGNEQPTTILTTVFIIAATECLILIPSYIKFFDSLTHVATRLDGKAIFSGPKNKIGYIDKVKRSTIVFVIVKNFLWVFPETKALAITDDFQSYNYSSYDFVNHFRAISMIVTLIVGIVWLVKIRKYMSSIRKDTPFMERLIEKYNSDVLTNTSIFARRRLNLALSVYMLGAVTAIDFYISGNFGMNVLPDVLSACCFLFGNIIISKNIGKIKIPAIILSALYAFASIASYYASYSFNEKYHPLDVSRKPLAFQNWNTLLAISVIESVFFASAVILSCMLIYETVKANTSYTQSHETIDPFSRAEELHRDVRNMLIASSIVTIIAAIGSSFRVYAYSIYSLAESSWLIEFAVTAIFVVVFIVMLHKIKEKADEKYLFS